MNDLASTIATYLAAWTEQDPDRRAALIDDVWADDCRLIDPPFSAEGRTAISEMAAALQAQFSGHVFRRASGIDTHHGQFRFAWDLVGPDGAVALSGLDVGELAQDGRLARITGFFGGLPTEVSA